VLTPDGAPVTGGIVTLQAQGAEVTASIERTGRFRLVPHAPGPHLMSIGVADLAPYRAALLVPPSKTLTLPAIRLSAGTYFRVRLVSPSGPVVAPQILRESYDVNGTPIAIPSVSRRADHTEPDGTTTIGPLPRGVTIMALNTPPFARTRLPDVRVTEESPLIDGGTVNVEPGAVLHVDVIDGAGAAVPGHEVYLEDAAPFSPLMFQPMRTDREGRVTFDRLASGRYRLRTRAVGLCGDARVTIARAVSVSGSGTSRSRLIVGGDASFRFTSSGVPLTATSIIATPESAPSGPPPWLRSSIPFPSLMMRRVFVPYVFESPCIGITDSDGRIRLTNFPPGSTRIDVRLPTSTWVRRVTVPSTGHEVAVEVPGGFLPVRVSNAANGSPVASAALTWTSGGARVEGATSVSGEALLGAAGAAPGTLAVRTIGYRPVDMKLREPPNVLHEVAIVPMRMNMQCRVVSASGEPVRDAVVEVIPEDALEIRRVAITNEKGVAFIEVPGGVTLRAHAAGYVVSEVRISADMAGEPVVTMTRGYRVIARVDSLAGVGPSFISIVNESGAAVNDLLDASSDRTIEAPGRVSLGPLPDGAYTIELRGPHGHKREEFHIENLNVALTFR
jgi:hypothetical protein